ncbi:MAG: TonB-dependent receptor [Sphingobium sp.]|uniref:TonB-dependent receptor n=1 Tax=Sphingobium sp. TaxID=1912891 RepID=UPI002E23E1F8
MRKVKLGCVIGSIWALSGGHALAQASSEAVPPPSGTQGIADIIVTARRVDESLQTTPIAVSVVSGAELESRAVDDLKDLARITPNLTLEGAARSSGGGFNSSAFLRGVGQDEFLITFEPGVGTYIDGVYLGRTVGGVLDLQDVQRVEVLRGPQGTLFGRNTIGGVVQVVSNPPVDRFEGSLSAGLRTDEGVDLDGTVNVPLGEGIFFRASGQYRRQDGYSVNRTTGQELGYIDRLVGRAQLRLVPSDRLTIDLAIDGSRARQAGVPTSLIDLVLVNNGSPTLAALYNLFNAGSLCTSGCPSSSMSITAADVRRGERDFSTINDKQINDADLWGAAGTIAFEVSDALTLKSITAYREMSALFSADLDGTDSRLVNTLYDTRQDQFSQELQATGSLWDDRLSYVAGLYYFRESASEVGDIRIFPGLFQIFEALPGPSFPVVSGANCATSPQLCAGGAGNPSNQFFDNMFLTDSSIRSRSYAAYGQVNFEIATGLRVTGGLRYTNDRKTFDYSALRNGGSGAVYGANGLLYAIDPTRRVGKYDAWTPKFGIDWQASPSLFLYASAAKGFKSGGFNGRATTNADFSAFGPETIWSYEVGAKTDLFDRRLRLNMAGFYSDYTDIQTTVAVQIPTGTASPVLNAGAARIYGAEIEAQAIVARGLRITAGIGLLNARYTRDTPPNIVDGGRLPKAPEFQGSLAAEYRTAVFGDYEWMLRGEVSHRSRQENEPSNYAAVAQPAYTLLSARTQISSPDKRWTFAIWGKNLTDETYLLNAFRSGGGTNVGYYARGREAGASLRFTF